MTRQERIDLIVAKAREHGLVPWEFLGGAIAESGRNLDQWERYGVWPDVSFGAFHQTVAFADEGDHTASAANIEYIKALYFDLAHACDVAARKYKHWRYDPEVSALQAWTAYNLPASYKQWPNVSNVSQRENYRDGLAQARAILGATPMPTPVYNPDTPLILQNDDWSCWPTSARMALESWSRRPQENWIEPQAIKDGIVSTSLGLLDGSGAPAAAWLTRQYSDPSEGTPTLKAQSVGSVSFDDVKSVAGTTAVMIGGRKWGNGGHWSFVRRYDPATDQLVLGNPAGTYDGVGQTMDRQQFGRVGPFSMILVTADGATAQPPAPVPTDPRDARIAELEAEVARLNAELAEERGKLGYLSTAVADAVQATADTIRRHGPSAA